MLLKSWWDVFRDEEPEVDAGVGTPEEVPAHDFPTEIPVDVGIEEETTTESEAASETDSEDDTADVREWLKQHNIEVEGEDDEASLTDLVTKFNGQRERAAQLEAELAQLRQTPNQPSVPQSGYPQQTQNGQPPQGQQPGQPQLPPWMEHLRHNPAVPLLVATANPDPNWERYIQLDQETGTYKAKDGTPPGMYDAFLKYADSYYRLQEIQRKSPHVYQEAVIAGSPMFQQMARQTWELQQQWQQYRQQQESTSEISSLQQMVAPYRDKLFELDEQGRVKTHGVDANGEPVQAMTPMGKRWLELVRESVMVGGANVNWAVGQAMKQVLAEQEAKAGKTNGESGTQKRLRLLRGQAKGSKGRGTQSSGPNLDRALANPIGTFEAVYNELAAHGG